MARQVTRSTKSILMYQFNLKSPIVLIIFKRPHTTQRVFEKIRDAKPSKLFIIADGGRNDAEKEKCLATRAIVEQVDWNCELFKNYSDSNLGCAKRVSSGLDWVFSQVEEAIILEDDCLPHSSFFRFCEELLEKYRNDNRISSISGQNVQFGNQVTNHSYYFSRYNHCWGWATWRRAWQHFDFHMQHWTDVKNMNLLRSVLEDANSLQTWTKILDSAYNGELDSWATRWTLSCWLQSSFGIISNVNLISNIGFDADSTNCKAGKESRFSEIPTEEMYFPLYHPPFVLRNAQADTFTEHVLFHQTKLRTFKNKLKKLFTRPYFAIAKR